MAFRIRWRDPSRRRPLYGPFHFDENGVSVRSWPRATHIRIRRFFMLHQNRQRFEVVDDAAPATEPEEIPSEQPTAEAVGAGDEPAPPPDAAEDSLVDDSDERGSGDSGAEAVCAEAPEDGAAEPGHLVEANRRGRKARRAGR